MGERGPLPNPNARRKNKRVVTGTVEVGRPTMPASLVREAKAEWRRVVPLLERQGVLTQLDRGLLIRYCSAWAEWVALDGTMQASQPLIRGRDGQVVRNPLWLMRRDADLLVTQLAAQLGLTPTSRLRAGVKHEKGAPADEEIGPEPVPIESYRALLSKGGRRGR